jgi:hypothetical protein
MHERHVRAGQQADPHDVDVLLHRRADDLIRRAVQTGVDDLHARVAQDARDDLRSAIVPVESGFCDNDAERSSHAYQPWDAPYALVRVCVKDATLLRVFA